MFEGDRVVLRALEESDAEVVQRWLNNWPASLTLSGIPAAMGRKATESWLLRAGGGRDHASRLFAIETKDGRLIGLVELREIQWIHRRAAIAFLIGEPDYVGRGYEADAVQAMVRFGFQCLNLHRVEARVPARQEGVIRAYREAGFAEEGRLAAALFVGGAYDDEVILGRLAQPAAH